MYQIEIPHNTHTHITYAVADPGGGGVGCRGFLHSCHSFSHPLECLPLGEGGHIVNAKKT